MMKVWFYAVFGLIFLSQAVTADNKSAAQEFVNSKLDAVFEVLQQEDYDKPTKHSKITEIVTPMFDFQLMAKLSLGRKYWPDLTQENKERFTELFVKRLKQSYLNKITTYTDEKIMYEAPVEVKNKIHVPTYLISKGKKIEMLYKTYQSNDNWKIYDIEIQGVSIIRSYRSQFREILQKGAFDDLLQKLQKPVNN